MDDLMRWVQLNMNLIEKEEEQIVQTSEHYWWNHGFKLTGRENFTLWQKAILQDAEYIDTRNLLEEGTPETNDPIQKAGLAMRN